MGNDMGTYEITIRVRIAPKPNRSTSELEDWSDKNLMSLLDIIRDVFKPVSGTIKCEIDGNGVKVAGPFAT
jgi:hypothetical protein